ncbi:MAG TPA: efflux RND transporter periplasmic adaptor subunit [Longimicrobium sp.]|nr:efflux RND transporter periplasmic adaptor subunit [Longimicrobium sp.]
MNTHRQILLSAAVLGLAVGTVGVYTLLARPRDGAAAPAGHDHAAMAGGGAAEGPRPVRLDAEAARRIGVTYATARRGALSRTVQTVGSVTWDETRLATVNPRIEGWVERLHVEFTGAPVRRGQPLMEVYSPMLVAAQEELILARRLVDESAAAGAGDRALEDSREMLESARRRLRYWEVGADEIARIERSGTPRRTVTLRSPADGVVVEKNVVQGARIMPGMELFRIAGLETVWVDGEVFEKDLGAVRVGQHARLTFEAYPGERFDATVGYVYPSVSMQSRTGRIRLALANPAMRLKPGMYARVELQTPADHEGVLIPRSAVHATGTRSLVFVRRPDGSLVHREVTLGPVSEGEVEVLAGLAAGEVIVSSANFLVDAESSMSGPMPGMDMPAPGAEPEPGAPAPAPAGAAPHAGHRM